MVDVCEGAGDEGGASVECGAVAVGVMGLV